MSMKWRLLALICISLMTDNVGNLFLCLLYIYLFPLEKCLFNSLSILKLGCLFVTEL
jgi:hypothetical protein